MSRLENMLEDLAGTAAPPTRLDADELYLAGRRRRHVRLAAVAAGVAAVLLVAATALPPQGDGAPEGGAPTGSPGPRPPAPRGGVIWADAFDADHLYARIEADCETGRCTTRLVGSDDGGATWTARADTEVAGVRVVAARTLVGVEPIGDTTPIPLQWKPIMSTDGGRSWTDLTVSATPVRSVPAGAYADCWQLDATVVNLDGPDCTVFVVEPGAARVAPLADPPDLKAGRLEIRPGLAGLWITGWDPTTGHSALAVSLDAGRSWRTTTFGCDCARPTVLAGGGTALAYASLVGTAMPVVSAGATQPPPTGPQSRPRAFRSDDGTTWTLVDLPPMPASAGGNIGIWLDTLADGTFVAAEQATSPARMVCWVLRAGGWVAADRTGLPATAGDRRATPGGYFAFALRDGSYVLYRSADWFTWTRIEIGLN